MNCPHCGRRTDILANYCSNCGVDLNRYYGLKKDERRMGDFLPLDTIFSVLAAAGLPALTLLITLKTSKFSGGAALTNALASIGPGGMVGGIVTLIVIAFAAYLLVTACAYMICSKKTDKAFASGTGKQILSAKASNYMISKGARRRLLEKIRKM